MERTGIQPEASAGTDRDLVARAQGGDLAAFEAIVAERLPGLYRLARAVLGGDDAAAGAASSTVVAAWRELPHLDDPARFDAWLDRILVSECRMDVERATRAAPAAGGPARRDATDELDREAIVELLDAAFESLDAVDRAVVVLHDLGGRTPAAIAGTLHMPVGTVRWRLHEAHESLRAALGAPA